MCLIRRNRHEAMLQLFYLLMFRVSGKRIQNALCEKSGNVSYNFE
jgi:hypothetical protein